MSLSRSCGCGVSLQKPNKRGQIATRRLKRVPLRGPTVCAAFTRRLQLCWKSSDINLDKEASVRGSVGRLIDPVSVQNLNPDWLKSYKTQEGSQNPPPRPVVRKAGSHSAASTTGACLTAVGRGATWLGPWPASCKSLAREG